MAILADAEGSFEPLSFIVGPLPAPDATNNGPQLPRRLLAPLLDELTREKIEREPTPGTEPAAEPAAEDDPARRYCQAEFDEAVAAAWEEGVRDGVARGRAEAAEMKESRLGDAVAALVAVLASEVEAHRMAMTKASDDLDLALGIARCVIPRTLQQAPLADVEPMLKELMVGLVAQPRLELRLSPDLLEPGRTMLADIAAQVGFEGEWTVEPDPALELGDAHLRWDHASAKRSVTTVLGEVERIIGARAGETDLETGIEEATSGNERVADKEGGS